MVAAMRSLSEPTESDESIADSTLSASVPPRFIQATSDELNKTMVVK